MAFLQKEERTRLKHIAHVLHENRLGFILAKLGIKRYTPFRKHEPTTLTPKLVLKIFNELGGSFIKLGQLLSLRPDLIPTEFSEALAELQDKVRPFGGKEVIKIIEEDFKRPINRIFKDFDPKPTASASIGQVHKAKLHDGTVVVVKVQRPNAKNDFQTDLKLFKRIAKLITKKFSTPGIDPVAIVNEFERYTNNELDYFKEAHNIDYFFNMFKESKTIIVPKVFWDQCSPRVITMKHIDGKRLTNIKKLKPKQRKEVMNTILDAEFEQIFIHGFFHADPHPGNFILTRTGKVALLDFGIVGRFDSRMKDALSRFYINMIKPDLEGMVLSAIDLGVASETTDTGRLKRDLLDHMQKYYGTPLSQIRLSEIFSGMISIMRKNNLKAPVDFVLLSKATLTLEGFAKEMDPNFNFVEHSRPFVKRLERRKLNPKELARDLTLKTRQLASFIDTIPRKTTVFLNEMSMADKGLQKIDRDIGLLAGSLDTSSNRLTLGFLAGCVFISATLLMPYSAVTVFGFPALSFFGFSISLVLMLALIVSILRERH